MILRRSRLRNRQYSRRAMRPRRLRHPRSKIRRRRRLPLPGNTLVNQFLSPKGDILADDRSNQLIIRDIPITIPVIDNLIRQLDRKSQQVEIEARVVSASRSFAQDIGTELGFAGTTTGGRSLFSGSPAVGGSGVTPGAGVPPNPVSIASGVTSGNGVTSGLPLNTNFSAGSP